MCAAIGTITWIATDISPMPSEAPRNAAADRAPAATDSDSAAPATSQTTSRRFSTLSPSGTSSTRPAQ